MLPSDLMLMAQQSTQREARSSQAFARTLNQVLPGNDSQSTMVKNALFQMGSRLEPDSYAEKFLTAQLMPVFQSSSTLMQQAPMLVGLVRQQQYSNIIAALYQIQEPLVPSAPTYIQLQSRIDTLNTMLDDVQKDLPQQYVVEPERPEPPKPQVPDFMQGMPNLPGMPKWEDLFSGKVDMASMMQQMMMQLFQGMMKAFKA